MATMYTKNGRPLQVGGSQVFGPTGQEVGQISGDKVFGPDGRYVGSIVGDRLIYRSTESAVVGSAHASSVSASTATAPAAAVADWGEEPEI